ncbi:hypothetical protein SBA2_530001 [Acidobacteriia bacterium SbA2]|nr:hypothetical protein SBA2_530001 [Acidobacteriia bacterium SbA2]
MKGDFLSIVVTSTAEDDQRTGAVEHNVLEGEIAAICFLLKSSGNSCS